MVYVAGKSDTVPEVPVPATVVMSKLFNGVFDVKPNVPSPPVVYFSTVNEPLCGLFLYTQLIMSFALTVTPTDAVALVAIV
jgi:hypothetical protein